MFDAFLCPPRSCTLTDPGLKVFAWFRLLAQSNLSKCLLISGVNEAWQAGFSFSNIARRGSRGQDISKRGLFKQKSRSTDAMVRSKIDLFLPLIFNEIVEDCFFRELKVCKQ